jgi:hypothetical protein
MNRVGGERKRRPLFITSRARHSSLRWLAVVLDRKPSVARTDDADVRSLAA